MGHVCRSVYLSTVRHFLKCCTYSKCVVCKNVITILYIVQGVDITFQAMFRNKVVGWLTMHGCLLLCCM